MLEFWVIIICLCGLILLVPYKLYEMFLYYYKKYEKETND